ncbi:MAG: hypothetical protein WBN00_05125 [Sedimenticolaceae bacterium]|jgi:hypothetical protein
MNELDDPRLSRLYRRAPQPEPGRDSDRIVLDAAHRAVSGRRGFVYRGWALAATLVLGVGIGWQLLQTPPEVASLSQVPAAESPRPPAISAKSMEPPELGIAPEPSSLLKRRESVADTERVSAGTVMQQEAPMAADNGREERASGGPVTPACHERWLAPGQPREAWLAAIASARAAGETRLEACLQQGYRELFFDKQP